MFYHIPPIPYIANVISYTQNGKVSPDRWSKNQNQNTTLCIPPPGLFPCSMRVWNFCIFFFRTPPKNIPSLFLLQTLPKEALLECWTLNIATKGNWTWVSTIKYLHWVHFTLWNSPRGLFPPAPPCGGYFPAFGDFEIFVFFFRPPPSQKKQTKQKTKKHT